MNGLLAASVALAALAAAALAGALSRPPAVAGRLTALTPARPAVADRLFIGVGRLAMWRRPTQTSAAGDLRSTGRRAVLAAVAALVAVAATDLATGLFLAPLAAAAAWQLDLRSGRARRRRADVALRAAVADVVEITAVAAGAGLNVFRSLAVAARASPPLIAGDVERVVAGVGCGQPLEEGLDGFARRLAVDEAAVFARMVGAAQRRGVPLAPQLEGLADSMRAAERHRVEARARTAPIRMLFPLAFLILPSFLLLSAVPVLVNALHQVRL